MAPLHFCSAHATLLGGGIRLLINLSGAYEHATRYYTINLSRLLSLKKYISPTSAASVSTRLA